MPEANALYTVTAVVVAGLVVWVALALKMAKEPWSRPQARLASARGPDVPLEPSEAGGAASSASSPAAAAASADEEASARGEDEAKADEPAPKSSSADDA